MENFVLQFLYIASKRQENDEERETLLQRNIVRLCYYRWLNETLNNKKIAEIILDEIESNHLNERNKLERGA